MLVVFKRRRHNFQLYYSTYLITITVLRDIAPRTYTNTVKGINDEFIRTTDVQNVQ